MLSCNKYLENGAKFEEIKAKLFFRREKNLYEKCKKKKNIFLLDMKGKYFDEK